VDLLGLALSLALPLQGGRFTGDYRLDMNPTFAVQAPTSKWGASATVVPGAVLYDPRYRGTEYDIFSNPVLMRHELHHVDQQAALGPGFWPAYGLTGGRAFEPYDPVAGFLPSNPNEWDERRSKDHNMDRTWHPPKEMRNQFPLFRVERAGDSASLSFLPGYPGFRFDAR
jgi:hypothetical protein